MHHAVGIWKYFLVHNSGNYRESERRSSSMKLFNSLKMLACLVFISQCVGCCCKPIKGITVRGGLDFREYKKPSGFVEMVDTGWDERRRREDLRWLENANCNDEYPGPQPQPDPNLNQPASQPIPELPKLKTPPAYDVPPAPQNVPPVPAPEPEMEEKIVPLPPLRDESVNTPAEFDDEEDYQQMIELSSYQQPSRSVANRPYIVKKPTNQRSRFSPQGSWLWAKP